MFLTVDHKCSDLKPKLIVRNSHAQATIVQLLLVLMLSLFSMQAANASDLEVNLNKNPNHFTVYLSPYGDDDNNGLSLLSPVMSLQKAHDILLDYQPQIPVDIIVNAGTYYFQEVKWHYTNGHKITFKAFNESIDRPVFDGSLVSDTWFMFDGSSGKGSYLNFRHIKVQNYNVAMTFRGHRENPDRWNGYNELYSMYFYRIGGMYYSAKHSTAAVRFINSRHNKVSNSHFVDVLNRADTAHLIHPVYLAHYSSNNEIANNRFLRSNGNPIAVRDSSNFNLIKNNRFIKTGDNAIYQEWYCIKGEDRCTKRLKECPSVGNSMTGNEVSSGYKRNVRFFKLYKPSQECGYSSSPRLRTSVNKRK